MGTSGDLDQLVQKAREDLAGRLGISIDSIAVVKTQAAEWRDSSLGCPEKGMFYMQVITPGYVIVLQAQGKSYEYHAGLSNVVLCDNRTD